MYVHYIILSVFFVLCFLNFLILFFVSAFLVRFRIDLMTLLATMLAPNEKEKIEKLEEPKARTKTWDQKYEDEIESISRRMRENADGDL